MWRWWMIGALVASLHFGCDGDLDEGMGDEMPMADGGVERTVDGPLTHTEVDGATETIVDASDGEAWVHVDFDARTAVDAAGPWDVAFQRFHAKLNGGVSGDAGVEVAILDGMELAAVTEAPGEGFITDQADGDDENEDPDYAISSGESPWYDYNPMSHTLSPKTRVYVVRTDEGSHYALQYVEYYDQAGTGGFPTFRWKAL